MLKLQKIDWNKFKLLNDNPQKSFEELCYHLFCRKFKLKEGVRTDFNQVGLETYPVKDKNKNLVGFQSKFFDNKLSDSSSVNQIIDSITKAKNSYIGLKRIIIFTHQSFGIKYPNKRAKTNKVARNLKKRIKDPSYKTKIENAAKPVKIEWFVESNFNASLFQPSNLDLAQLYFGFSDDIGFIKNSVDKDVLTFLQSSLYLNLPSQNWNKNQIKDLKLEIKQSSNSVFLLTGTPGSGKSILMHKLLEFFGGLDQTTENKMIRQIISQGAVPTLINLKNCASDSLENILRGRQNDCCIRDNNLKFIYLFDGLDELSEQKADYVLSYIAELRQNNKTQKIVVSCRTGNLNKVKAKAYFNDISEFTIADLDLSYIEKYFQNKSESNKIQKLNDMKSTNPDILREIKDILLVSLLWDTIDELSEKSIITDLFEMKINMLIDDPKHKKNIEGLNLLNPKKEVILSINQEISYLFQKKFQYRFPQKRLQEIILKKFPRLDYTSVNIIIDYIADLFFDIEYSKSDIGHSYIYQHRRYQEFFFAQKLKLLYEENPKVLRELNIFSNHDFFEDLFLKYLRRKYEQ